MAPPRHNNIIVPGHIWLLWLLLLLLVTTRTTRTTVSASSTPSCFVPSLQHPKNRRYNNENDGSILRMMDPWRVLGDASKRRSATIPIRSVVPSTCSTTTTTSLRSTSKKDGTTTTQNTSASPPSNFTITNRAETIICGGGPAGLLSAIMLAQKFPNHRIHLFDRQKLIPPDPMDQEIWSSVNVASNRFLIGLGGRGITALQEYGVWDDVQALARKVPGRKDWIMTDSSKRKKQSNRNNGDGAGGATATGTVAEPYVDNGVERMLTDRAYATHVLPRDKLVSVLHEHILKKYYSQVTLHYGRELEPIDFDWKGDGATSLSSSSSSPLVVVRVVPSKYAPTTGNKKKAPIFVEVVNKLLEDTEKTPSYTMSASKLLVVADGNTRTFIQKMEQEDRASKSWPWQAKLHVKQYVDDNPRIYKSIPFQLPPYGGWKTDLNYSVRAGKIIFDALPVSGPDYCGVLLLPQSHPMAQAKADPKEFDSFLRDTIPQFYPFLTKANIEQTALKDPSFLPTFSYLQPRLYHKQRVVMVGDCVKTVKPYFGLGANSALEDVRILGDCIDQARSRSENQNDEAIIAAAIIQYSKKRVKDIKKLVTLSHGLDRPGPIGTAAFLIPIILDGMFRGMLPMLFKPNIINLMQNEKLTFQQAARRKRFDRIGQLTLLGFFFWGLSKGTRYLLRKLFA